MINPSHHIIIPKFYINLQRRDFEIKSDDGKELYFIEEVYTSTRSVYNKTADI